MIVSTTAGAASSAGLGRGGAALGLAAFVAAALAAMSLFSASDAANQGLAAALLVPLRMLALVALASVLLRLAEERWNDVGLRRPRSWRRTAGLVLAGYVAVAIVAAVVMQGVLPWLGVESHNGRSLAAIEGNLPLFLIYLLPIAWGSAAFGEELVFRGFVQTRLERLLPSGRLGALAAVAGQAAIFGSLHAYLGAGGAILAGATGLVLGAVYLAGGRNLWACFILHGLVDTVSLTALYFGMVPA